MARMKGEMRRVENIFAGPSIVLLLDQWRRRKRLEGWRERERRKIF